MNYQEKRNRLGVLRQNMANKMLAGADYDREVEEIAKISAELKMVEIRNGQY